MGRSAKIFCIFTCSNGKKGKKRDMTTKIILKAMRFYAYHGVAPQERKVGNTFMVDLELTAPLVAAVESDRLEDTINYAEVYATVRQEMQIPSQLLEHAAVTTRVKTIFPAGSRCFQIRLISLCMSPMLAVVTITASFSGTRMMY